VVAALHPTATQAELEVAAAVSADLVHREKRTQTEVNRTA
jgi:hypothetical protein